ncbi:MAG: polysaccharide deacetylase family protein [Armatimonadetes bacterium]|nr:polysaccharide deacetylase family protein [Armatimonadota bacterium]MDI9585373.1 polysaccharide deacetylase family protein [Acidobacteriota bacterium]
MTRYIAAYDTEAIDHELDAVPVLVALHRKYEIPATFFVVGRLLERDGPKYREILNDPLFDVQSHSYSHQMLKDSRPHGPAVSLEQMDEEVGRGKRLVEDVFERECIGFRPGCGFEGGFSGVPDRLEILRRHGIRFVSADLRGPLDSIPNPLKQAYTHEPDGYPDIMEIPGHGWHDNVLKGWTGHITYFPPVYDFAIPPAQPRTVVEVFAQEGRWLEHALETGVEYVSLVQHPWSIMRFDAAMAPIELLLVRVKQLGMPCTTYLDYYRELTA